MRQAPEQTGLESPEPQLIGRRYQIVNTIGSGGMGEVYRVIDRLTGQIVTLKRVLGELGPSTRSEGRTQDARMALAREFQVLAGLRHPNIISVLDYGFDGGQPYFTMDLQEAALPLVEAARQQPLSVAIDLFEQLLQALRYLHRRGVLHRDLKPSNVLVVRGQVKLLDFGISIPGEEARPSDSVEGTVAYLAPEVLQGRAPSRASDLYAVGVMLYQLLLGRHPFDVRTLGMLVHQIVTEAPDLSSPELDPRFRPILARLLSKEPTERYGGDAEQVHRALGEAIGRPLAAPSALVRESFLQSATLVGRDAEMTQLRGLISGIVAEQPGSVLLVGGESGVGKSRLLAEARTLALVRGALVLQGQAISEGGGPFLLLREPVRWLAMAHGPGDAEASVLRVVVPELASLLGRPVQPAPRLEPGASLARLMDTLEALFLREARPMLLLLEDLHWAGPEALVAVRRLAQLTRTRPLLIVGSWRDDEAPGLPDQLPEAAVLRLPRLSDAAVARLASFMLGEVGERPELVALLARETEGNAFFVVEAVRDLLEEGRLQSGAPLPERLLSGGVRRVALRRLSRVLEEDQRLLRVAAVAGRQIDRALCREIFPDEDIDKVLARLTDAAVLEPHEGRLRFSHDKLREVLLEQLSVEARRGLHRRVAEALEQGGSELRAAALALHWAEAGDQAREMRWRGLAGDQALQSSAYEDALQHFERALALAASQEAGEDRARWRRQAAECRYVLGDDAAAFAHLSVTMAAGGVSLPRSPLGLVWMLLSQLAALLLGSPRRARLDEAGRGQHIEMSRAASRLCQRSILASDQLGVLAYSLLAVNLADKAGYTVPYALGVAAFAATTMRLNGTASRAFERAREAAADDPFTFVELAMLEAAAHVGVAHLEEAERRCADAIAPAVQIQHRIGAASLSAIRAQCCVWPRAEAGDGQLVIDQARDMIRRGNGQGAQMAPFTALSWLLDGRGEEAVRFLVAARALIPEGQDVVVMTVEGALALVLTRMDRPAEAAVHAATIMPVLRRAGSIPPVCQHVFTGLAETAILRWRRAASPAELSAAGRDARAVLAAYAAWSRLYPVGWPEYWRFNAEVAQLEGRSARALRALKKSLALSRKGGQRLHQALALIALSRFPELDRALRLEQLTLARAILEPMGMRWYLQQIDQARLWIG